VLSALPEHLTQVVAEVVVAMLQMVVTVVAVLSSFGIQIVI
jgi:hypothetical protein